MPRKLKVKGPDSAKKVDAAYRASGDVRDRERLQAIRLAQQGRYSMEEIAAIVGRARSTLGRWIRAFRAGGIKQLLKCEQGGKQGQLSARDRRALRRQLRRGRWKSAREIQQWLRKKRHIQLTLSGVYYWVHRVGGV